jgi:hypothetical protein
LVATLDERRKQLMPNQRIALFAASGLLAAICGLAAPARAQYADPYGGYGYPPPPVVAPVPINPYPYLFGNQRYCWYDSAWNGPGWYYCGYAYRRGYGWGGGYGWNGWRWNGRGGGHGGGHYYHH